MRRNKVGSIFLVSVLALAGIGISYAGFTDTISVYGTVSTATVDLVIKEYSNTYVWKIWDFIDTVPVNPWPDVIGFEWNPEDEMAKYTGKLDQTTVENGFDDNVYSFMLVAKAEAKQHLDEDGNPVDDEVDVIFDKLFPCIDFVADFIFHYEGSIPAKLYGPHYITEYTATDGPLYDVTSYTGTNWMEDLWLLKHPFGDGTIDPAQPYGIWFEAYKLENVVEEQGVLISYDIGDMVDLQGLQVHSCDYIWVKMIIHLPQDNIFQGCSGTFNIDLEAIQWNDMCID